MQKNIVVIEGDGIGPEVTRQAIKVLDAAAQQGGHEFTYKYCLMGADAIDKTGSPLPDDTIEAALNSDAILFGAIGHPKYDNDPTAKIRPEQGLLKLRKSLQLFANIRPYLPIRPSNTCPAEKQEPGERRLHHLRELTGGIYFGKKELDADGNRASDDCVYTAKKSRGSLTSLSNRPSNAGTNSHSSTKPMSSRPPASGEKSCRKSPPAIPTLRSTSSS